MRQKTKVIIQAIASLLHIALTTGGYFLMVYILSFLTLVSPLSWLICQGILSMTFLLYQVLPVSDKVVRWIESKVTSVYRYFKFRPRETSTGKVYYAEIIV